MQDIQVKAKIVAAFLKGLANEHRLKILCELAASAMDDAGPHTQNISHETIGDKNISDKNMGEKSVGDLIAATGIAPTSMSQHLSKLKAEGIVDFRRDHRVLYYFISHDAARDVMAVLYQYFCQNKCQN